MDRKLLQCSVLLRLTVWIQAQRFKSIPSIRSRQEAGDAPATPSVLSSGSTIGHTCEERTQLIGQSEVRYARVDQ